MQNKHLIYQAKLKSLQNLFQIIQNYVVTSSSVIIGILLIDKFYESECRESPRLVFYFHNKMLRPIHAIQAFIKSFQMSLNGVNGQGKGNSKHRGEIYQFFVWWLFIIATSAPQYSQQQSVPDLYVLTVAFLALKKWFF